MRTRAARWIVFALLLGVGIGAAVLTWTVEREVVALDTTQQDLTGRTEGLIATALDVAVAQITYLAQGQPLEPAFERAAANLRTLTDQSRTLPGRYGSADPTAIGETTAAVERLSRTDAAIREHLRLGDVVAASDLIVGDAHQQVDAIVTSLRQFRAASLEAITAQRQQLQWRSWAAMGGAAAMWLLGLLLLVRIPSTRAGTQPAASTEPLDASADRAPSGVPPVDLLAAADLCTAISRVTTTTALPDLLARAAALLDASGVIVWMGAGEELFAATAHGYDQRVIGRLGPISRAADNATAAAWRTGEVRTVAGDMVTNGAIVAPMYGPDSCIGVLAAEVRHGREADTATRAVTTMIAAQLATAVIAWPAASAPASRAV